MILGPAVYPIDSAEEWADKYQLEILSTECLRCGAILYLTRPFATKELRGLTAFPCSNCGETKVPFIFTYK